MHSYGHFIVTEHDHRHWQVFTEVLVSQETGDHFTQALSSVVLLDIQKSYGTVVGTQLIGNTSTAPGEGGVQEKGREGFFFLEYGVLFYNQTGDDMERLNNNDGEIL